LQGDVSFNFFGHMRVEVTGIYMDFTIGVMILLGQRMEKFFNLAFVGLTYTPVMWIGSTSRGE